MIAQRPEFLTKFCWLVLGTAFLQSACVSNENSFSDQVSIEALSAPLESGEPRYVLEEGILATPGSSSQKVQWFTCTQGANAPGIMLLNAPAEAFQKNQVCQSPVASEFLNQGFNIVALNRPGQGESSGKETLGGEQALEGSLALITQLRNKGYKIQGLWAYDEASLHGFRLAKNFPFSFLIIGNGIYDWDETLKNSGDKPFVAHLQALQGRGTEAAMFAEQRSIAWDFSALPKHVFLYHNQGNLRVPVSQATAFKNSLAAGEFRVELLILDQEGHRIPTALHRGLVKKLAERIKAARLVGP